jgi:Type I phosphodiesterase / nucleotide pyrophosphatase.
MRDQHAGCVASYLVEHDLFDFLLLSLPDNDTHSHKHGPAAQVTSIANADRQLERMMHAAGGSGAFLDEHAVIIVADHSHAKVERRIDLGDAFEDWTVLAPNAKPGEAEIALCPAQRSGMVYVLVEDARHAIPARLARAALKVDGIDLAMFSDGEEGVIASRAGQLRFAPGGDLRDPRGAGWSVDGELAVLAAEVRDGVLHSDEYPDALARVWAALTCPTSGDVLLSAGAGWEFADWGGVDHVGGGSHGSLHHSDSLGALAFCGVEPPHDHQAWSIVDMTPMIWRHFGVEQA